MIEEKFKTLESNIFSLLEENKNLKVELELLKESLSQCLTESAESIKALQEESQQKYEALQLESAKALNALQTESAQTIAALQTASSQALETLQTESAQALQELKDENELVQSRNAELTIHLKKIMSRLESLGVQ